MEWLDTVVSQGQCNCVLWETIRYCSQMSCWAVYCSSTILMWTAAVYGTLCICTTANNTPLRLSNGWSREGLWGVNPLELMIYTANTKSRPIALRLLLLFQQWVHFFAWNNTWLLNHQIYILSPSLVEIYRKITSTLWYTFNGASLDRMRGESMVVKKEGRTETKHTGLRTYVVRRWERVWTTVVKIVAKVV